MPQHESLDQQGGDILWILPQSQLDRNPGLHSISAVIGIDGSVPDTVSKIPVGQAIGWINRRCLLE